MSRGNLMLIRELATLSGTTVDTIRYYEKQGLLNEQHLSRKANGYRSYNRTAVERLHLIKCAKTLGFRLLEIKPLLASFERNDLTDEQQETLLAQKVAEIEASIHAMEHMKTYLKNKLQTLQNRDLSECQTGSSTGEYR